MAQLTVEEIEKQEERMMAFEQEQRDFEMAFRLARVSVRSTHEIMHSIATSILVSLFL